MNCSNTTSVLEKTDKGGGQDLDTTSEMGVFGKSL